MFEFGKSCVKLCKVVKKRVVKFCKVVWSGVCLNCCKVVWSCVEFGSVVLSVVKCWEDCRVFVCFVKFVNVVISKEL